MRRQSFTRTAWFTAVLHLLVSSSLGAGLVLCVESDGTRNIESRLVDNCCTGAQPGAEIDRLGCGCEDSPVVSAATLLRSSDLGHVAPHFVALVTPPASRGASDLVARVTSSAPARGPDFAARRTIVLLV
jgi:hypothetical protein